MRSHTIEHKGVFYTTATKGYFPNPVFVAKAQSRDEATSKRDAHFSLNLKIKGVYAQI